MSPNVDPEEARAILGDARPAAEVEPRDFSRPLRFSEQRRTDVQSALERHIPDMVAELTPLFPTGCQIELVGMHETRVDRPLVDGHGPLAALDFRVGGQPSWVTWDAAAAVGAVEGTLGSTAPAAEARALSDIEATVLGRILLPIATHVAAACNARADDIKIARDPLELTSWEDVEGTSDAHRIEIELSFQGPGEASTLSVYVPAPGGDLDDVAAIDPAAEVPRHMERVEVEVRARIPGCEVSLAQLLELEEGDVIPIDARVGDPATLMVEGQRFAHGQLGSHRGQLAVRIEHVEGRNES